MGNYNSVNNAFPIKTNLHGDLLLPVLTNEAQDFREKWNSSTRRPQFAISNDKLALSGINFISSDGTTQQYNFVPAVEITISEENLAILKGTQKPVTENLTAETSKTEPIKEAPPTVITPETTSNYDLILLRSGQEIKAKVSEITLSEIKYKAFDNIKGPTRMAAKKDVIAIIYANGQREVFGYAATGKSATAMNSKGDFAMGVSPLISGNWDIVHFGICGKFRYSFSDVSRFEGSFSYLFPKENFGLIYEAWEASLNLQAIFANKDKFSWYGLTGLVVTNVKITETISGDNNTSKDYGISGTMVGLNTGIGIDVKIFNNLFLNSETKFMTFIHEGSLGYRFMGSAGFVFRF